MQVIKEDLKKYKAQGIIYKNRLMKANNNQN